MATFYFNCLYELGAVFEKLENVDVVLFVVDKQVLVVVRNTNVLSRVGRALHGADLLVLSDFSMVWNAL